MVPRTGKVFTYMDMAMKRVTSEMAAILSALSSFTSVSSQGRSLGDS